jgi:hypothetical protein
MNPITNMKNLNKMNDRELEMGLAGTKNSWHAEVKSLCKIGVGLRARVHLAHGLKLKFTEGPNCKLNICYTCHRLKGKFWFIQVIE